MDVVTQWISSPAGIMVVLGLALAYPKFYRYVIYPWRSRQDRNRPLSEAFELVDWEKLPPELRATFDRTAAQFGAIGFEMMGLAYHRYSRKMETFVAIFANRQSKDNVQLMGIRMFHMVPTKVSHIVLMRTLFSDGSCIATSNSTNAGVYPPDPLTDGIRCPNMCDQPLLYRFHRARVERGRGVRTPVSEGADTLSILHQSHEIAYQRLVAKGYYVVDEAGQQYKATLKGNYLMVYRLLWPLKQICTRRADAQADKALRELGFGRLRDFGKR